MLTDKTIGTKPGAVMGISPEKVDEIALKVLKRDVPKFLLPMNVIHIDGELELRYELSGNRFSYFNEKMVKRDYITLLKNMLLPYKMCADWFLDYHNLYLNRHYMMYNKNNYDIKYVYIPTRELVQTDEDTNKFFQNFVINIEVTDDNTYPMKLLRILMSENASPVQLLEVISEQNDIPAPAAEETVRPVIQTASILNQGTETIPELVPQSASVQTPEMSPAASRPGVGSEFGKVEVGGDIMGNLFGDNISEEKPVKNKKAPKTPKAPKQPKESGLFGGLFGGKKTDKKTDKKADSVQDLSGLMGQQSSQEQQPTFAQTPVMTTPVSQRGYAPVSSYLGDDRTEIFEEDYAYTSDNMVRLQLEDAAGFQLPALIEIDMSKGYATVGRLDKTGKGQCDYNFNASMSFISRNHFRLEKVNEQIQIIDLNSANGTFVNGTQIVSNIPYNLSKGDLIMFSSKRRVTYKML